jgi:hypothetical protein
MRSPILRLSISIVLTVVTVNSKAASGGEFAFSTNEASDTLISDIRSGDNQFDDPVLSQNDKWGWDLHEYKSVGPAYRLNHEVYFLISKGTGANGNVRCCEFQDSYIWNPLTGEHQHLDLNQRALFENQHKSDVVFSFPISYRGMKLESGNSISIPYSPGFSPKCYINYTHYYDVTASSGKEVRSFYVIMKLDRPEVLIVPICQPESVGVVREPITELRETPNLQIAPLADGGALFWSLDKGFILRFDEYFQQHSTIHGRISVINADEINSLLEASPERLDPQARDRIFANAMTTSTQNDKIGDKK